MERERSLLASPWVYFGGLCSLAVWAAIILTGMRIFG